MKPTNQQLRQLLVDLGFDAHESVEPNCLVFEHAESKARVLMPSNRDKEPAREADVLSIRTHLMYRGHLDQAGFERFMEEGTLRAS
ncbi:MAG: hypothetical protein JW818_18055 [Pirellulales bacterium]|nr:hypothetical protein [Pirellulales bacterium]